MNSIRFKCRIDSETLHLPELEAFIGKDVEITVVVDGPTETDTEDVLRDELRDSLLKDDAPCGTVAEDDWEAHR